MSFFREYLITIAGRIAGAVAALISLPILLEHLGASEYSLIAFASLVQGYANILDAGLSPALSANVAKRCSNREESLNIIGKTTEFLAIKFLKYSPLMLSVLITTAYVTLPNIPLDRLAIICIILLIDAFVSAAFRLQYSALQGYGDHAIANGAHTLNIVFRTVAAVWISSISSGVEYIYLTQILFTSIAIYLCFYFYRAKHLLETEKSSACMSTIAGTAPKDLTIIAIFLAIMNSIPLLVLGRIGGNIELNHFFLATSLGAIVATLQGALISVLIPGLSRTLSESSVENKLRDFRIISRNIVCVYFLAISVAFCLAEPLIGLWIRTTGIDRGILTDLFRFQLTAFAFVSLTLVPYALSIPLQKTRIQLIGVGFYLLASCIALPTARLVGDITIFGMTAMVLSICFSVGYFYFSLEQIGPGSSKFSIGLYITRPVGYVTTALVISHVTSTFLNLDGVPKWSIITGIYVAIISGIFILAPNERIHIGNH